jgi:phage gp29-like protein
MRKKNRITKLAASNQATKKTAATKRESSYVKSLVPKAISQTRADIQTWKRALQQTEKTDNPKWVLLQQLYTEIANDARLTSQMQNRDLSVKTAAFVLNDANGKEDEEATKLIREAGFFSDIVDKILEAKYYAYSLIELTVNELGIITATLIDRTNIEPKKGIFFADYGNDKGVEYRNASEYNLYLLEFRHDGKGLLNKSVPHVLFKKFAQSCWSELCEIYGIPPRYMKTNTQDSAALARAEQMMRDMGSAAWFIIDETEDFEFAKGVDTNGDVYKNFMAFCNNEISLLITGAIIGQDTEHGNRSKEKESKSLFEILVDADKVYLKRCINETVLPALVTLGVIKDGLQFDYVQEKDKDALFDKVIKLAPHYNVDPKFINDEFGIPVSAKLEPATPVFDDEDIEDEETLHAEVPFFS